MEHGGQQFVNNQVYERDYEDGLAPGYRFCPTDAELIVYYLKAKIEKDQHPPCRMHEVNIYNYSPDDLAAKYRSCDDKWYFLTPRERKCLNGSQPNRKVGNFGTWKASQKDTAVCDVNRKKVGSKRSLAFHDVNDIKTQWLMHEYITERPNLPVGTGPQTMLSNCVLCKIYKKETKEKKRINQAKQVVRVQNDQVEESNQLHDDEPSPKRTRLSDGASTSTSQYYDQSGILTEGYYQQNQQMSLTATNHVSDGASTSTPNDDQLPAAQTPSNMIVTTTTPLSFAETSLPLDTPWINAPDDGDAIHLPADDSWPADDFGYLLQVLGLSPVH